MSTTSTRAPALTRHTSQPQAKHMPTAMTRVRAAGLSEPEQARLGRMARFAADLSGYMKVQSTRPQTLAYGLTDSPGRPARLDRRKIPGVVDSAEVPEDAAGRDQLLTNVMLCWLTATAGSSAQLYAETAELLPIAAVPPPPAAARAAWGGGLPARLSDAYLALRRPKLPKDRAVDRVRPGGHFAAMEKPDLLVGDLRASARILAGQPDARALTVRFNQTNPSDHPLEQTRRST